MEEEKTRAAQLLGRALPTPVGSYVVERRLSAGSSYADYEAHHRTLGHGVLFRHERWPSQQRSHATGDNAPGADALEGLRRSRRLQAELQHPHILPVIDFFEQEGEWFSVFARIPGACSLHDIISSIQKDHRPPSSVAEFVTLSAGVTDGLAAIHRAGFVHRTLGTNNVLIDSRGHALLADLGCATPVGAEDPAARAFHWFMRPASAAPEQFAVEGMFSPAIDIWALGVALFALRYGRHPFWTEEPTTIEGVMASILGCELRFPPVSDETAEHLLQPWFRRLLEPALEKRCADALEAQRDLHAIATEIEGGRPVARAFVAMPFADTFDGLWRAIRSACVVCRVSATRVDQSHLHENIWDDVCDAIRSTDFTIAVAAPDLASVPNPNVMLEIGYARALHKPVLLLTDAPDTLPFDLRTQRALCYTATSVGGGEFHRELVSFVSGIIARWVRENTAEAH
jgi:serine/threonine protein kinase